MSAMATARRQVLGGLGATMAAVGGAALAAETPARAEGPALTEGTVLTALRTWYHGTNEHLPVEQIEALLAADVEMRYPNKPTPLTGRQAFRAWYAEALASFFDETHVIEKAAVSIDGDRAVADLIVRWESRSWTVGAARSQYRAYLTQQRVELARRDDGRVEITRKVAGPLQATAPLYAVGG